MKSFTTKRLGHDAHHFADLTFAVYRPKLLAAGDDPSVFAVGAYAADGVPIGLVLGEVRGRGEAVVDTLCVREADRRRGVGTALLREAMSLASSTGCRRLSLRIPADHPQAGPVRALTRRLGWNDPKDAGAVYRLDLAGLSEESSPNLLEIHFPEHVEPFLWKDLGPLEREAIKAGEGDWFPPELSPFLHEERMEPLNSLGLRKAGEGVIAWVITQALGPETIHIRHLFARSEYRHLGYAMLLAGDAILLQMEHGVYGLSFHVERGNVGMARLVKNLLSSYPHRVRSILELEAILQER